jgi:hypothetical protein
MRTAQMQRTPYQTIRQTAPMLITIDIPRHGLG